MKKVLALILALLMVMSMGVAAFADAHTDEDAHGGTGKEDTPKYGYVSEATSPDSTTVYLNVDQDATSDNKRTQTGTYADGDYQYEYDTEVDEDLTVNVTVPLFICMYAYGGDGYVVTPEDGAYKISNESKFKSNEKITEIRKYQKVYANLAALFGEAWDDDDVETIEMRDADENVKFSAAKAAIVSKVGSMDANSSYGFYIAYPGTGQAGIDDLKYVLTDSCKNFEFDESGTKKTYPCVLLQTITADDGTNDDLIDFSGTKKGIGDEVANTAEAYTAMQVSSVEVTQDNGWVLVNSNSNNEFLAHELKMTLTPKDVTGATAVDLAEAVGAAKSVVANKWTITAAQDVDETVTKGSLPFKVTASIAGESVNADSHDSVLRIKYVFARSVADEIIGG